MCTNQTNTTNQSSSGNQASSAAGSPPPANNQNGGQSPQLNKSNALVAYGKAINGYQFQVGRYNTWMNYYAIFVGALFVALYSIWPQDEMETLCCVYKPHCIKISAAIAKSHEWILPLIISGLGWIASICWYGALLGYRKWNGHWIGVVQKIEKIIISKNPQVDEEDLKVYLDLPKQNYEDIIPRHVNGYISTQKITGIFIFFVALAWNSVTAYILSHLCYPCDSCCTVLSGILGGLLTVVSLCGLHHYRSRLFSSDIIDK